MKGFSFSILLFGQTLNRFFKYQYSILFLLLALNFLSEIGITDAEYSPRPHFAAYPLSAGCPHNCGSFRPFGFAVFLPAQVLYTERSSGFVEISDVQNGKIKHFLILIILSS